MSRGSATRQRLVAGELQGPAVEGPAEAPGLADLVEDDRDLLIWLTLCVIFATLVLQGLTLPLLIRALGIREDTGAADEELRARKAAARTALERIEHLRGEDWVREDSLDRLRAVYDFRHRRLAQRAGAETSDEDLDERSATYQRMVRDLLDAQRTELVRLRDAREISDDTLRALMRELDLEDQRLEI